MTDDEMATELGHFWLILNPKCEPFTEEDIAQYTKWYPLAEYRNQFGVVYADDPLSEDPPAVLCDDTQRHKQGEYNGLL